MGGMFSGPAPVQYGSDYLSLSPEQQQMLTSGYNDTVAGQQHLTGVANNALQNYGTNYQQFVPNLNQYQTQLNSNFAQPNLGGPLDSTSQGLLSQQNQQAGNQLAAQQQQIGTQFGASNPALAQVLQAQAGSQSALANNGNVFQAGLQQQARQAQQYQLGQQAQSLGNQTALAQSQNNASLASQQQSAATNAQNLQNQALSNQVNLSSIPMNSQQTLMALLSGLASQTGVMTSSATPPPGAGAWTPTPGNGSPLPNGMNTPPATPRLPQGPSIWGSPAQNNPNGLKANPGPWGQ